ncbi:hypothetical protein EYF80_039375 [Liparis tanakae]|uniref:Uncharacterized protein n=1 Tax=Liparis tanakae TaxID=230148 RepID=A0A4Z2GAJ9_9TELE|nr:hypothetical protein EYF80_039375 [Liparis tanakae]
MKEKYFRDAKSGPEAKRKRKNPAARRQVVSVISRLRAALFGAGCHPRHVVPFHLFSFRVNGHVKRFITAVAGPTQMVPPASSYAAWTYCTLYKQHMHTYPGLSPPPEPNTAEALDERLVAGGPGPLDEYVSSFLMPLQPGLAPIT